MIIFPAWWQREHEQRLQRHVEAQRTRRLTELRYRLQTPLPAFLPGPGRKREVWRDEDAATLQVHVDNLAALLKLANMDRATHATAAALKTALIRNAPLLEAGAGALGTLGLPGDLFAGVVAAFDRQHALPQQPETS